MSTQPHRLSTDLFRFSTRQFEPGERFARYSDLYSIGADTVALGSPVSAEIVARRLGRLLLFERRLAGLGAERLAARVRSNQFDHFTLQLNLAGEFHGEGPHGFRAVRPGEILLLDMAKPMRTRMPDTHLLTLTLARAVLEAAGAAVDELHGLIIPAADAQALTRFLLNAAGRAEASWVGEKRSADEHLAGLLGSTLATLGLAKPPADLASAEAKLQLAQSFIRDHLYEETLSPERVARAAHLSRATLYRLFEDVGGVRKYIQSQRLARLRRSLSNPSDQQSVAALAHDAGFASEHHASRSFKQEFGLPPAQFRREMRLSAQSAFGDYSSALKLKILRWYSDTVNAPARLS